jgi:hypothetical protein
MEIFNLFRTGTPQTRMTAMERMLNILFQYSMNESEWDSVIQATEKTAEQTLFLRKVHKSREHGNAVHAADLVSNQFFTLLLLLNRLRPQLRKLTEQRALVAEFIENYYGDAPIEMEDGLNEAFAAQIAPYAEPIVRELRRAEEETGYAHFFLLMSFAESLHANLTLGTQLPSNPGGSTSQKSGWVSLPGCSRSSFGASRCASWLSVGVLESMAMSL